MKDIIILEKARKKKELSGDIKNTIALAKVARASNFVDLAGRYKQAINNANLDETKKLELTGIKNHWKRASQIKIMLDWLNDWILVLTIFVRYSCRGYDNEKMNKNIKVRQKIKPKQVSSLFVRLYGFI